MLTNKQINQFFSGEMYTYTDFKWEVYDYKIQKPFWFLATLIYESNTFKNTEENGNYSANRLLKVFPKYFKNRKEALLYARNPEKIFNRVYANRMGNGNEASGDGYKYKGRGFIQLTGKNNYTKYFKYIEDYPQMDSLYKDLADEERCAMDSAAWYWKHGARKDIDKAKNFKEACRLVNGGLNGYAKRVEILNKLKEAIRV